MNLIKRTYGIKKKKFLHVTEKMNADSDIATVQAIKDLKYSNVGLTFAESNEFIEFLCTN